MMYRYEVQGTGYFPDDMLRYDQAEVIGSMDDNGRKTYVIQGKVKPTVGRWNSFLWSVRNIEVV